MNSAITLSAEPVFIVGITWRHGTTAMQRLLNATGSILIWGEPWHATHRLQTLRVAAQDLERMPVNTDRSLNEKVLAEQWTAVIQPSRDTFVHATRRLYEEYFGTPALVAGRTRWGFKEVHLTKLDLLWLRELFPRARFVILDRDPVAAWASYVNFQPGFGAGWRQPENNQPIATAKAFAQHWRDRAQGMREFLAEDNESSLRVRFEDLRTDPSGVATRVLAHVGVSMERLNAATGALSRSPGASSRKNIWPLTDSDVRTIQKIASDEAHNWGYSIAESG